MSGICDKNLPLTTSAIHVGPIITCGLNEIISIVIPLSTESETFPEKIEDSLKNYHFEKSGKQCKNAILGSEDDKTKGCPFVNCSRYGRAFSRSHDLKRHIARHKIRRELLPDLKRSEICDCSECEINFIVDYLNSQDQKEETENSLKSEKNCMKYTSASNFETLTDKNSKYIQTDQSTQESKNESLQENDHDFISDFLLIKNKSPASSTLPKKAENIVNEKAPTANKLRCNYCLKIFKTKWTLNSHIAAHEGRYHFNCNQCGKKFVRKSHFEGHMRSHEAARPYNCEKCGKTFKELKHRREHEKRKHPEANSTDVENFFKKINLTIPGEILAEFNVTH